MDEKVVKELLKRGYMVTPDTLKRVEDMGMDAFFSENKSAGTFLMGARKENPDSLRITVRRPDARKALSTSDIAKNYASRYSKLRDMLSGKMEAVSINKSAGQFEASVIGMVRRVGPQGFFLEDLTGSIEVMSRQKVDLDDVVGVKGVIREGILHEREVLYPDVPLNRKTSTIDARLSLSVGRDGNETAIRIGDSAAGEPLSGFMWICLEKAGSRMNILAYMPGKDIGQDQAAMLLRKRHLCPTLKGISSPEDQHTISPVPDFLWIVGKERWKSIYKGVVVFSTKESDGVEIDLSTRELTFR